MQHLFWLDAMKGVAMFLVVLSHAEHVPLWLECFFTPFFLTSFFFASGYLFQNPDKPFLLKLKIVRLIESLLIPYLIYWIASFVVAELFKGETVIAILTHWMESFVEGKKLWFISCLLCAELLMIACLSVSRNAKVILCSGVFSLLVWKLTPLSLPGERAWCINIAFVAYFFMTLGYSFRKYESMFSFVLRNKYVISMIGTIYFTLVALDYAWVHNNVVFALNIFSDIYFFVLSSIMALACLYIVYNKIPSYRFITYLGSNSLLIYFFHKQVLDFLKRINAHYLGFLPDSIIFLWEAVGVIVILILPIAIVNRYIPILSGKSKWLSKLVCHQ